jgi:hypothetical protein
MVRSGDRLEIRNATAASATGGATSSGRCIWSLLLNLSQLSLTRTAVLIVDGLVGSGMLGKLLPRDGEKPEAGRT